VARRLRLAGDEAGERERKQKGECEETGPHERAQRAEGGRAGAKGSRAAPLLVDARVAL
jgi:hypothetical protein